MKGENQRWLNYEGCNNFRDLGGYATRDGRTVLWRRVYRADTLARLTDNTAARAIDELGLRTLVDLRTTAEIDALGAGESLNELGPRLVHLPTENPDLEALRQAGAVRMGELYLWDLDRRAASFAKVLGLLADAESLPCVIQCNSGKDRTGIVIALILDLLGVPEAMIVEEYMLTEEALTRVSPAQYQAAKKRMSDLGLDPKIVHTHPATMTRFLGGLRAGWGTAEDFAKTAGVDGEVIAAVRANLLFESRHPSMCVP